MPVVDVHTHFIPMELVEFVASGEGPTGLDVGESSGGDPLLIHDNGLRYPVMPLFHDPAAKLEQMDRDGIDVSVLSLTPSLFLFWADAEQTARLHRVVNDAAASLVRRGEGRLMAMASVPMNDPVEAARELRRAREELGLVAVQIGTSVGDVMLDDPSLEPFFAAAEVLAMPVMLHPYVSMVSPPDPAVRGFHLANVIGNPFETFVAAARLIVGGVLDRHPGLIVQLVHGGGAFPYQLGRLDHAYAARSETGAIARRPPAEYLGHFLFDTIVFDPRALAFLLETVGPDHVMFGTDIPFDMADLSGLDLPAHVGGEVAEAVLGGNALALFGAGEVAR